MEIINRKNKSFEIAKQKVEKIKSLYNHFFVYCSSFFYFYGCVELLLKSRTATNHQCFGLGNRVVLLKRNIIGTLF